MEREKISKPMNRILNCEQSRAVKRKSINFWQDWIDFWTVGNGEEKMCKMATTSAACSVEKDISPKRTFPNIWPPQKCLRSRQGERVLDGNNFCSLQCKDGVFSKNTFFRLFDHEKGKINDHHINLFAHFLNVKSSLQTANCQLSLLSGGRNARWLRWFLTTFKIRASAWSS